MDFSLINIWAVLVCGVVSLIIGSVWYSPLLFGKIWQREAYMTPEKMKNGSVPVVMGGAFVLSILIALNMALFFGGMVELTEGFLYGFFTGLFFVGAALGILYLFEKMSFKLWLINAGYFVINLTVMGGILAGWE